MPSMKSLTIAGFVAVAVAALAAQSGWTIPPTASDEKNPAAETAATLRKGKALFESHCQHCHGRQGKGDGPDADPTYMSDMDLTALDNPDGVIFYKVWNGRKQPKMPAFKSEMTKDEVWTVVTYVKSLGK